MLISIQGKLYSQEQIKPYALHLLHQIESAYQTRQTKIKQYLKELNGQTVIPPPKLKWQSTFVSSLFYQKIFFAYALLRKFLDKAFETLFDIETDNQALRFTLIKTLSHYIKALNLKENLSQVLFYSLLSGYGLLYFDYDTKLKKLSLQTFNPLLTKITPDKNYLCITKYIPTIEAITKYNLEPSANLFYNLTTEEEETYHYLKNIYNDAITRIDEIYGILVIPPDDALLPAKFTILNKTDLISVEIFPDEEKPFAVDFLYGVDIQSSYADLIFPYHVQDTILTRTLLDTAILSLTIGIELDASSIDPDVSITSLEPFQIVYKKSPEEVIRNFSLANFNPNVLPIRHLILQEATNISAITEFVMGLPTSKGRPTAKEVMLKTQQSLQTLSVFIEKFETSFISKTLEKLLYYILKYEAPNLQELLTPEEFLILSELKPIDIQTRIKFKITSFSQILQKQEKLEKILSAVSLLSELNLAHAINPITLLQELLILLDLPQDLINPQALLQPPPQTEQNNTE